MKREDQQNNSKNGSNGNEKQLVPVIQPFPVLIDMIDAPAYLQ
jgi:hypothetical protein